uniref:Islet cell autoantigen Ica1 C-terminal domain-containing protein n=1 Tax=Timema shepardi TaxID=629360 RepID=A0A7R9ARM7_TIMSH|nr:unnamed protein product [Timema shepardi]
MLVHFLGSQECWVAILLRIDISLIACILLMSEHGATDGPSLLVEYRDQQVLDTTGLDLLTSSDDNFLLLDEILNGPPQSSNLGNQWDAVFGGDQTEESSFLPSQILDQFASLHTYESKPDNWETVQQSEGVGGGSLQWTEEKHVAAPVQKASTSSREINKGQDKKSTWLNLFADLDPLADPDALDRKAGHTDRNC